MQEMLDCCILDCSTTVGRVVGSRYQVQVGPMSHW